MQVRFLRGVILSTVILGTFTALPAQAQFSFTFASFTPAIEANSFTFSRSSTNASLFTSTIVPVNFQYQVDNGLGTAVGQNILGTLTLSALSDGPTDTLGPLLIQPMKEIELRFSSQSVAPGTGDLLSVKLSTGTLAGVQGSATASLIGTESNTASNQVIFDSRYLDFSGTFNNKNFSIAFNNLKPTLALDSNGQMDSFTATATGNFASNPLPTRRDIPEPASGALLALAGAVSLVVKRYRK